MKYNTLLEKIDNFYKIAASITGDAPQYINKKLKEVLYELSDVSNIEAQDLIKSLKIFEENINLKLDNYNNNFILKKYCHD